MDNAINTYLNLNATFKHFYIKNHDYIIDENIEPEQLFFYVHNDTDIILCNLKVTPNKCGYNYWIDAAYLFLLSGKNRVSICKDIYQPIAQKYHTTTMAVERAMRLCFEDVMYNSKNTDNHIISYIKDYLIYPHNSELLIKLVELVVSNEFRQFKSTIKI